MQPALELWAAPNEGPPWASPRAAREAPRVDPRPAAEWEHTWNASCVVKKFGTIVVSSNCEEPDADDAWAEIDFVDFDDEDGPDDRDIDLADSTCVNDYALDAWDADYEGYYDPDTGWPLCPTCGDIARDCDCDD